MDQYSIQIIGNGGSVNIDFKELLYKLAGGEILIGKTNDFPENLNIQHQIDWNNDWVVATGSVIVNKGTAQTINLSDIIDDLMPTETGESVADRGVTVEVDLFFYVNHKADDDGRIYHFSATANKIFRLNILRTDTRGGGLEYWTSDKNMIHESGRWVEYDSDADDFASVNDSGILSNSAFTITISQLTSGGDVFIRIDNNLHNETSWPSTPKNTAEVRYKIKMLNHAYPTTQVENQYTNEKI
jgi:hypothetical protein